MERGWGEASYYIPCTDAINLASGFMCAFKATRQLQLMRIFFHSD
jgi:hypothetical protein